MKKLLGVFALSTLLFLSGCNLGTQDVQCGAGTEMKDGQCVPIEDDNPTECDPGEVLLGGVCVEEQTDECDAGQVLVGGVCVDEQPQCNSNQVLVGDVCEDIVLDIPDWFTGWTILNEPIGDKTIYDLTFTETGFSVYLGVDERVGIQMLNYTLEPGFSYEVTFDFSSSEPGKGVFVQLQGHSGYQFTNPGIVTSDSVQTFSQTLVFPPEAYLVNNGWLTIELTPSGVAGEVFISNINVNKVALPDCGENEKLSGTECVPDNNGYLPNGTPTAWFTGWEILTVPTGNKDISDYEFSETGFTAYLDNNERTGIQFMNYVFEPGYEYTLSFDYTASAAGRMIWVQMEALGGYGFTNTDTWTIAGTNTFSQTLVVPSTYDPVEPGWIKLELTPSGQDNITIENIVITKTPIN